MHNRLTDVYKIDLTTEEGILTAKHWLHNHLENAATGGIANFYTMHPVVCQPFLPALRKQANTLLPVGVVLTTV